MPKPTTLAELQKISEATNIPIATLQKEYSIYEYTFLSCEEAASGYHKGFDSNIFNKNDDEKSPDTIAYLEGWKKISLKTDVTKLSFEEAMVFIKVCYRHGDQFELLVECIEKLIGTNKALVSRFIKEGRYHTFYSHNECPNEKMIQRVMKSIDLDYQEQIKKANDKAILEAMYDEAIAYGFDKYRPFPDFFEKIGVKSINLTLTIAELETTRLGWQKSRVRRWKELVRKSKSIKEILPSLKTFLELMHREDEGKSNKRSCDVNAMAIELFSLCKNADEAASVYSTAKQFTRVFEERDYRSFPFEDDPKELRNALDYWYYPVREQLLKKEFPRAGDLRAIASFASRQLHNTSLEEEIDTFWIKETQRALQKPIPSFIHLYQQAHKSFKGEVLHSWNQWGKTQLDNAIATNSLKTFDLSLIPIPRKWRGYGEPYHIWPERKECFSTFVLYLVERIKQATEESEQMFMLQYVIANMKSVSECANSGHLFTTELKLLLNKIILDASPEYLWKCYEIVLQNFGCSLSQNDTRKVLLDGILEKGITAGEILNRLSPDDQLYSVYMRMKVEETV